MYCSKCGTAIPQNATFCTACGQPVSQPATPAPNAPPYATTASPPAARPYGYVPSGTFPPVAYAGFWLRVVAHLIDGVLVGIAFAILLLIAFAMVGVGHFRELAQGSSSEEFFTPEVIAIIVMLAGTSIVMMWLYYAWMESSPYQGTLGKMALGLVVTDLEGRRITFARASGRYFAKIITGLIPLGIGYAMAGFTEKKLALHDIIAGCLVLRKI
ncbi:MAG: RDD family protein [Candidatus Acidiferrales bacterium]